MSKSVLVIDTPENCGKCRFVNEFWCRVNGRILPQYDEILGWCPLRPLPEKMDVGNIDNIHNFNRAVDWNTCIDEIAGESKG